METLLSFDLLMQLLCINAYSRYTLFNIYFILHSFPGDAVLKKKQNKQKKKTHLPMQETQETKVS